MKLNGTKSATLIFVILMLFLSKQQKEGGKHIKKYIFLLLVFRLRLIINHALGVSVFFIFSLVQA